MMITRQYCDELTPRVLNGYRESAKTILDPAYTNDVAAEHVEVDPIA